MTLRLHRPALSPLLVRPALALLLAFALAGCAKSEASGARKDDEPSGFQIAKAIVTNLLSNSVEAKKQAASEPDRQAPAPREASADWAVAAAQTELSQTCEIPYNGPVTVIPVRTATALARSVADRPARDLVYETDDTAIFEDGRVLTTALENVGSHINAVGWSANPVEILGASVRPGSSRMNVGASSESSFGKKKRRKRRRRG